ncbi:TPA: dTMP kinase [Candidatus Poribacteria bacterium]|nr:dTMP kinase [Candidatus Poribacteria bacterium]
MSNRGVFISLEGIEGCGKSTQAKILSDYMSELGYCVVQTREPGGTPVAEKIREVLLDPKNQDLTSRTELLLYLASRSQHVEQLIMPALKKGKIVICERFSDSTRAYQGYARGLDMDMIETLIRIATGNLEPDLTIILDMEVKEGLLRAERFKNYKDRLESENLDFHNKVRRGYLEIAKNNPNRIKVISAKGSIDDIHLRIRQYIDELLSNYKDKPN